jgi:dihydrofolate reductase
MINAMFTTDHWGGLGLAGHLPWPDQPGHTDYAQNLIQNDIVVLGAKARNDPRVRGVFYKNTIYIATHEKASHIHAISGDLRSELTGLEQKHSGKNIWVCGGADVLSQCVGLFDQIHVTYLQGSYKIDVKLDVNKMLMGYTTVQAQTRPGSHCCTVIYKNAFSRNLK